MTSVRNRVLQAAMAVLTLVNPATASAWDIPARDYGSCQLKADGLYIAPYCYQLDPSRPNSMPSWFDLYGADSLQWTEAQRRTYFDCHCQSYDQVAAQLARWGVNIENHRIAVTSGPGGGEVGDAIRAEMDAAFASVGGTPFFSSPWVYPGPSMLEGHRRDPIVTETIAEVAPDSTSDEEFDMAWGEDGYSRMPGMTNVHWTTDALGNIFSSNGAVNPNVVAGRLAQLRAIDRAELICPDPTSRLGAYEATRGYPRGSVGYSVHNAIGDIYMLLGTAGQEQIGVVFNSAAARSLFSQPVSSWANLAMATMEYQYWAAVLADNPNSFGGQAGEAFKPAQRAWLQEHVYSRDVPAARNVPQAPPPALP